MSLSYVMDTFTVPGHKEELVHVSRLGLFVQLVDVILETFPLRLAAIWVEFSIRVVFLIYQAKVICSL